MARGAAGSLRIRQACLRCVCVMSVALLMGLPRGAAAGHHSAATFDTTTEVTLTGTVTSWRWFNPHCLLEFDVTRDGVVTHWTAETSNPADMTLRGWARSSFKTGDVIAITLQPACNGSPVGRIVSVVLPDGKGLK